MHDIDSALQVIRARDATAATLAQGMWELMRAGAAHPRVTRYDVQRMVWGAVPHALRHPKSVLPDRHTISGAFAELLDLLGYPRYAELCRGQVTSDILDAAEDEDRCDALVDAAWRESGIEPPNTPIVTWNKVRGPVEEALHGAAGRLLEEAIDTGALTPDRPDTEDHRVALTLRLLTSPDNEGAETWFVRLLDERLAAWIIGYGSQTRREMLVRLRPEVRNTPDITDANLPALRLLLTACRGDGARLTQSGYLPTALVHELIELMPTCREHPGKGRSESSWPPILLLRDLATDIDLVRVRGRRLRLTALGRQVVDDSDSLLMCVGEGVVTFEPSGMSVVQEVVLAALLLEPLVEADRLLEKAMRVFEEDGLTGMDGKPFGPRGTEAAIGMFADRLRVLDAARIRFSPERVGLTEAGRSIARWALRARVMRREVPW